MQNKLITVIVPIYNVEKYIKQCLDSLVNQTYENLEIICVDDCGNDGSMDIVKKYANEDSRIKILKQNENKGCGEARNLGIDNASGEYIYFIDSDDFVEKNYIKELVNIIEKENVDLVCNVNILKYYGENDFKNKQLKDKNQFILDKKLEWNDKLLKVLPISAWCKLYKTDLLKKNKIYFADNKLKFEDFYFWYILKNQLKNIYIFYGSTYFYRQRNDSTMSVNKYNKNDCFDSLYIIELIYKYYKENNVLNKYSIPFSWLNKYFKKMNNKSEFFILIKKFFNTMKDDIFKNENIYNKKDINFFSCILDSNKYYFFKAKYFLSRIFGISYAK